MTNAVLRHSKHLSQHDMELLDNDTAMEMLSNKFVMRAKDSDDSNSIVEEYFTWLRDTCENFYHVDGPHRDQEDILYYIYFKDKDEAKLFKLTF